MLSTDPVLQEMNRQLALERGAAASPVVKHFTVIEQAGHRGITGFVTRAAHPLVLHAVEDAIGQRVVPAIPLAAHRAIHAVFGELGLERAARVLVAAIRVMSQSRRRLSARNKTGLI